MLRSFTGRTSYIRPVDAIREAELPVSTLIDCRSSFLAGTASAIMSQRCHGEWTFEGEVGNGREICLTIARGSVCKEEHAGKSFLSSADLKACLDFILNSSPNPGLPLSQTSTRSSSIVGRQILGHMSSKHFDRVVSL